MKTIEIANGIRLTATQSTIDTYLAEKREAEVREELKAWLEVPEHRTYPEWSDIHKDVYGFRP